MRYGQLYPYTPGSSMASSQRLGQHEARNLRELWRSGNDMLDEDNDRSPMARREHALESQACLLTSPLERSRGLTVVSRPLRHGDVRTVKRLFDGLSERSRRYRFNGPKPCLSPSELELLSTVDTEHQAVVAYLEGRPIAIARLVRSQGSAEIAFAVVDDYQRRGIGSALVSELFARARTAGITEVTALVSSSNTAALALIRRLTRILAIQYEGSDLSIRAVIA